MTTPKPVVVLGGGSGVNHPPAADAAPAAPQNAPAAEDPVPAAVVAIEPAADPPAPPVEPALPPPPPENVQRAGGSVAGGRRGSVSSGASNKRSERRATVDGTIKAPSEAGASQKTDTNKTVRTVTTRASTRFGSNTIESERISPSLHLNKVIGVYDTDPFFNVLNSVITRQDARVAYVAASHGVVFRSTPMRNSPRWGVRPDAEISMVIGGYQPNLVLVARTDIVEEIAYVDTTLASDNFDNYLQSGIVTDRAVGSALNPIFGNQTVARAMAGYLLNDLQRYDNTMLYAKGAFLALQAARVTQENLAVVYPNFPANAAVMHINIDQVGVNVAEAIGAQLRAGSFVLFAGQDFDIADLDIVYWLACPGRRVAPNAAPMLASFAIHWPSIKFCVLRKGGDDPAVPAAAEVPPHRLWLFLQNMAANRGERDFFVAGIYAASCLVNGRLVILQNGLNVPGGLPDRPDTDANNQLISIKSVDDIPLVSRRYVWHCYISPLLEGSGEIAFPAPREYNFLQRYLRVYRTENPKFLVDYVAFGHGDMAEKLLYCATLAGCLSIFATTVLQSYQIRGRDIQNVISQAADAPATLFGVAQAFGIFKGKNESGRFTSQVYRQSIHMLKMYIGGEVPIQAFWMRQWNAPVNRWNFAQGPFNIMSPNHPPRFGNPMCMLNWVSTLPAEWGLIDVDAKVDFTHEVALQGPDDQAGWYATSGEADYNKYRLYDAPYSCIPYGALAMSAIAQALENFLPAGAPPFSYQRLRWDRTGLAPPEVGANPDPPVYIAASRCFEPCTVMTWNWETGSIYAPILTIADTNRGCLQVLNAGALSPLFARGFIFAQRMVPDEPRVLMMRPPPGLEYGGEAMETGVNNFGTPMVEAHSVNNFRSGASSTPGSTSRDLNW